MSCCGGNKNRIVPSGLGSVPQPQAEVLAPVRASAVVFRYDGLKPATVYGNVTGRKYWFGERGAEVVVDLRDRAAMRRAPNVTEVRLV